MAACNSAVLGAWNVIRRGPFVVVRGRPSGGRVGGVVRRRRQLVGRLAVGPLARCGSRPRQGRGRRASALERDGPERSLWPRENLPRRTNADGPDNAPLAALGASSVPSGSDAPLSLGLTLRHPEVGMVRAVGLIFESACLIAPVALVNESTNPPGAVGFLDVTPVAAVCAVTAWHIDFLLDELR